MQSEKLIDQLQQNARRVPTLIESVAVEQAIWRPAPEKWSILEITAHLLDEEREDFRARVDLLLHSPGTAGPPIDPQGWVSARRYNERDLKKTLAQWVAERHESIKWLRGLTAPAWENVYAHPVAGPLHAGDLLGAWVAHDWLHIRQLASTHYLYLRELAKPYQLQYAGDWS